MFCDITQLTIGCFILIILITLFLTVHRNFDNIEYLIPGFYIAPPDFCTGAGLDSFLMYIGEKPLIGKRRTAYILATQGDKMVINTPIDLTITWDWLSWNNWLIMLRHSSPIDGIMRFKEEIPGIPQTLTVLAYPTYGKLVLSNADKIYALLYRDARITEKITQKLISAPFEASDMKLKLDNQPKKIEN